MSQELKYRVILTECQKRHSGKKYCRTKNAGAQRHKPFTVLPNAKIQMSHYVLIENLIINQII